MESARKMGPGRPGPQADESGVIQPRLRHRLRYAFDNTMARGTPALVGWLAAVTGGLIVFVTALVVIFSLTPSGGRHSLPGKAFTSLTHAMDPGTVAGDSGRWQFVVLMLLITIAGLFIVSALIGVVATGLDTRIQQLRKGRSLVIEQDHTLILGWSDTIFTILSELEIANESEKKPSAVILADMDKVEMDDLIREKVDPKVTRVITRTGDPIDLGHLALVRPETARSIIVLAPQGEDPDSQVIKTVLALTQGSGHRERTYHIVAEISEPSNLEPARLVAGEEAVLIDKREMIARLVVHAARQSGASVAFTELLDFGGDEIYFRRDHGLEQKTFGDAQFAYEDCSVIGLFEANGDVLLNPPAAQRIEPGQQLIAIAEDDTRLATAAPATAEPDPALIVSEPSRDGGPQRVMVLGWNRGAASVVSEFDNFLRPGSEIVVATADDRAEATLGRDCSDLSNARCRFTDGETTDRATLEQLNPEGFDHLVVLCSDRMDAQHADARTLVTLLHLRDIAEKRNAHYSIVSEMLDDRNRQLAEVTRVDDVIVSEKVISLMLAQISENPDLTTVFTQLFSAEGSEIYLRPASEYLRSGAQTNFATVIEAARRRDEAAIGYRRAADADDARAQYGVRINPPKSEPITVEEGDRVIVLAEE
jgi:ion channel POLLUX/CASTOR